MRFVDLIIGQYLVCSELFTTLTGADVYNVYNSPFSTLEQNGLFWKNCYSAHTDGASAMTVRLKGFVI